MNRFVLKLLSSYLLVILLISGLLFAFSVNTHKRSLIESKGEYLEDMAGSLLFHIRELMADEEYSDLQDYARRFREGTGKRMTVINRNGRVIADSDEDPAGMENHLQRPEIREVLNRGRGENLRYSSTVESTMLYVALPLVWKGETGGFLRISTYLKEIQAFNRTMARRMLRLTVLAVFLFIIIALYFSRRMSRPLNALIRASEDVSAGDFTARISIGRRHGEFRELGKSFNQMTAQIDTLFREINTQKMRLKEIIDSMNELLVVIDEDDRIILTNTTFLERFGRDTGGAVDVGYMEEFYWKVIYDLDFEEVVKKTKREKRGLTREMIIRGHHYICSSSYIGEKKEIIVVLHDISESKNLETIKKDFISNVSHELKTPLTSIKGFIDTLLEEESDPQKAEHLRIIQNNTERINNIVKDLLVLSKLEHDENTLQKSPVDLVKLLQDLPRLFKKDLEAKKLSLEVSTPRDPVVIHADSFKLEQLFINLIDNAVKYTEEGRVRISVETEAEEVIVRIRDTGIGISPKDQSRVFERFYVVDRSRSRQSGGTGLGLSIVKHIVLQHSGTIRLQSRPHAGSEFIVRLPRSS